MIELPVPILGFVAWSGTGKTTLLTKLIPLLKTSGLRVALIKHAHHHFKIDHPGKDSHRLRKAGADQIVIASKHRIATIRETPEKTREPELEDVLENVHLEDIDLLLVEGFKMASIPKIEIHRHSLGKPYLYPDDRNIIALAQDTPAISPMAIEILPLNQAEEIAAFVLGWLDSQQSNSVISLSNVKT